ncbi:MAG: T9SS type A sorting domain-containing protein, partial [candidate division Zixibacteria bacterium]|nr:T9SS type A sorting domain-containing protein [candidate division Zixibacteria bacterium]
SFADADSFHIDIMINVTGENIELCGGGFAFELYSPDNSIEAITHLPVANGYTSTSSIEYLNGFDSEIFNIATITYENGWGGDSESKSMGTLPDSVSFILAGINCLSSTLPEQEYIRLNLSCNSPGTICLDSISNSDDDVWDWLFESKWAPITFGGPYCFEVLSEVTDIAETNNFNLPDKFELSQNYPNPFNPSTTIELALPRASEWGVSIYNVLGQRVEEFTGYNEAGIVSLQWDASKQSSGIYFYKAVAGDFADTRKMILLK